MESMRAAKRQLVEKPNASRYRLDVPDFLIHKIVSILEKKYDGPMELAIDVGCGFGESTTPLATVFERVLGMDNSPNAIEKARKLRAWSNVTYRVAKAEDIPCNAGTVQLVTASSALEYFKKDVFFQEAHGVLCNNGILAVYRCGNLIPVLGDSAKEDEVKNLHGEFYDLTARYDDALENSPKSPSDNSKSFFKRYYDTLMVSETYASETIRNPFQEVQRIDDVYHSFDGELQDIVDDMSIFSGYSYFKEKKKKKAVKTLAKFGRRLKKIVRKCKINPDRPMKLYRDVDLTVFRKIVRPYALRIRKIP